MSFDVDAPTWVWEAGTINLGGDYPLQLTLADDTLGSSPGSLLATIANGTPYALVTLSCSGSSADPVVLNLDESGSANLVSVPIAVSVPGTYVLVAFTGSPASIGDGEIGDGFIGVPESIDSTSTSEFASANFTVSVIATPGGVTVPTPPPPPDVQPSVGVKKWVLQDPATDETYHFEINPSEMTTPFGPKNIVYQATTAIDGQKLAFEGQRAATSWSFKGKIKTKDQYDALLYWSEKPKRIWITDHFGRAWLCYITHFAPVPIRDTSSYWTHEYNMDVLIFDGPKTPV